MQKRASGLSVLVLPQHEQFYPEGLSVLVLFPLGLIRLAPKFKDFQGLELLF